METNSQLEISNNLVIKVDQSQVYPKLIYRDGRNITFRVYDEVYALIDPRDRNNRKVTRPIWNSSGLTQIRELRNENILHYRFYMDSFTRYEDILLNMYACQVVDKELGLFDWKEIEGFDSIMNTAGNQIVEEINKLIRAKKESTTKLTEPIELSMKDKFRQFIGCQIKTEESLIHNKWFFYPDSFNLVDITFPILKLNSLLLETNSKDVRESYRELLTHLIIILSID